MMTLTIIYCLLCLLAAAWLQAWRAALALSRREERRRERLYGDCCMRLVTARILDGGGAPMARFPMCDRRGAKAVLARTLAAASASTCFDESCAVRRMMAANGIEGWLLRRVKHSHGCRRAEYLAMLAALPVSCTTAEYVRRYADDRDRHTRFRTMLVAIAADPSDAVRLLAEYPAALTPFELAELTAMLRRGILPLACDPLLASTHCNLRMLGMNIARIFGITECGERLFDLAARNGGGDMRRLLVDTVVSLHLPVTNRRFVQCVRTMNSAERRALFRRLAAEGYSSAAIGELADAGERHYADSLVASYKCSLVCRP